MNFKPKNWNDPQSVARAAIRLTYAAMDAAFNEADHPRAENGEFGSGGGSESKKEHPFIASFLSEHKSTTAQKEYLEKVPAEKLRTALTLASKSDSESSRKVAKLIEKELDSRADRGTSKGYEEI